MLRASLLVLAACTYTPPRVADPPGDAPSDTVPVVDMGVDAPPPDAPPAEPIASKRVRFAQHLDALHDNITVNLTQQVAGRAYILAVSWNSPAVALTSVSDTSGNTYVDAGEISNGSLVQRVYYAVPVAAAQSNTVTAQFGGAVSFPDIRLIEFAGIATTNTLDQYAEATGISDTPSVGPVTTTYANETLLAFFAGSVTGAGPGWVQRISSNGNFLEEKRPGATGTFTATALGPTAPFVAQLVTLRGAL